MPVVNVHGITINVERETGRGYPIHLIRNEILNHPNGLIKKSSFSTQHWLDNDQTKARIEELGAMVITRKGRYGGTWVSHVELVYAYAAWISPEFHRVVLDILIPQICGISK